MRLPSILLLVAAALLASTAQSKPMQVKSLAVDRSLNVNIPAQRFLRSHHSLDEATEERGVASILEKVKGLISSKVPDKTLQRWAAENQSPKHAFTHLKLDKAGAQLFKKPKFGSWVTFMTKLNQKNPEAAMLSTLMTRYSDDALSQMLIKAKSAARTKDIATKLQAEQLRVWASQGKSADDVFNLFKLSKNAKSLDELVDNPQFATWTKYVDDVNAKEPEKASPMVVKTLTTYYTNTGLYKMLDAATNVASTKKLATDLQKAQVDKWLTAKVNPTDVFRWVGAKGTAQDSVERSLWRAYREDYNKKFNPAQ